MTLALWPEEALPVLAEGHLKISAFYPNDRTEVEKSETTCDLTISTFRTGLTFLKHRIWRDIHMTFGDFKS